MEKLDGLMFVLAMACALALPFAEVADGIFVRFFCQPNPIEGTVGREAIHAGDLVRYIGDRFLYLERVGTIDSFYKIGSKTMARVKLVSPSSNAEIVSFPERDLEIA